MTVIDAKFSTFADGGDLVAGDIVVGLRGGLNTKFSNTGGVGTFLPLTGGTMTGAIEMSDNKITGLALCTDTTDAASKAYVDSTGSGTVNSGTINQITYYAATGTTVSGTSTIPSGVQDNITRLGTIVSGVWNSTVIGAAYGGTGLASPTAHGIMVAEGSSAMTPIVLGAGQVLIGTTSGDPSAAAINSGTGILVGNSSGSITVNLAAIADHTLLANISGGALAPSSTTLTALIDNAIGSTQGDVLYRSATAWSVLAPSTSGFALITGGAAANPSWAAVGGAYTASALSKGDDTNVTLTLTGTPSTALLQATTITAGWTGQLSVARGGTGLAAITAHDLIIGNGTSAATLLAPSATSGVPLISQGASADPAYGTAVVAGGGTGNTTFTAYSLICAGTTATGAFQNVSGVGTSGQVLQSNGAAALPTWATIPGATSAALSKGDDTNVTLTLTGAPTTALLTAATITAGWTGQLGLTRGGTAASLTASNGGIVYSTASALAILSGTATAGQMLQSGASTTPAWSTATYPATAGTSGNVITSNGTNFVSSAPASQAGLLIGVQVFTATGTYTPTSGMVTYIAEACGGGGGSGGAKFAISSLGATGGGGAGGYLKMKGTAADIGASKAVTIGTGGTAGVGATPTNGGNGAATSLSTLWSCGGGIGSIGVTVGTTTVINAGGVGGTNTVTTGTALANIAGGAGSPGQTVTNVSIAFCGRGGNSQFGQGGITQTDNVAAIQGTGYGAGASGAMSNGNDKNGAVGQDGYMIIYEYS